MLKALIIDDEVDAINSIELILNEYCPNVQVVGRAGSVTKARREIIGKHPDFIILDIEMPRGSGFDLLEFIPERDFDVIFVTAYNNYAIKAFKYSAVDYILKPVDIDELIKAVNRVEKIRKAGTVTAPSYEALLENLKAAQPSKLAIHTGTGMEYILI
jgi:two-component system LytT family response regulator